MKKAFVVIAVLIAVVASTGLGGVKTASAFNPQPDPPDSMPDNVRNWFNNEIFAMFTAIRDRPTGVKVGTSIVNNLPDPGNNPGLSGR